MTKSGEHGWDDSGGYAVAAIGRVRRREAGQILNRDPWFGFGMPRPVLGELVAQRQVLVLQREAVRERVAAGADDVARVLAGVHRYGVVVGVVASAAGYEDVCRAVVLCVERELGEFGSCGHLRLPSVVTDWVTAGVVCLPAAAVKPDRLEAPRKLRRESCRRNKRAPGRVARALARRQVSWRGFRSGSDVSQLRGPAERCRGRRRGSGAGHRRQGDPVRLGELAHGRVAPAQSAHDRQPGRVRERTERRRQYPQYVTKW